MKVDTHKVVTISYTMSDEQGSVLDSSDENGNLPYIHGTEFLAPGIEASLEGKSIGDTVDEHISADKAFGTYSDDLVFTINKKDINIDDTDLKKGLEFEAEVRGEIRYCLIEDVQEDKVVINANHPLAGVNIHFQAEVLAIRDATAEELDHGHVHDEHGHHHDH
ncbi:FKBP-type peptidyl-prolyl cis-trans isomerase [Salinispira pacifica]|uniref:Peptidyl-prolyl cis-trans isomerase n=1 Tax=Salinispira pacifica TaxID=1307761 RepID=V5WHL2_9SPIO|nr:FKBP-type peptidyl-prolyl cis-trans isomerase [Salinispira pacifica]AHC15105.1 FKBP-type peptidyl-prolyl cis-trans isomerase SlyD [Salinispira pacifica]